MFYIIFVIVNFLSLGVGVWLAMRDAEMLGKQTLSAESMLSQSRSFVDMSNNGNTTVTDAYENIPLETETEYTTTEKNLLSESLAKVVENTNTATETNDHDSSPVTTEQYDEVVNNATDSEVRWGESNNLITEAMQPPKPSEQMLVAEENAHLQFNTAEITATMVNLIESSYLSDQEELKTIVGQLQEIHELIATLDDRYYMIENVESFITKKESKYVSTQLCRPVIKRCHSVSRKPF